MGVDLMAFTWSNRGCDSAPVVFIFIGMLAPVAYSVQLLNPSIQRAQNRVLIEMQSILTQLIFDHALRMRAKTQTEGEDTGEGVKEGNFVGKMNNMVTADLASLQPGQNFLRACK